MINMYNIIYTAIPSHYRRGPAAESFKFFREDFSNFFSFFIGNLDRRNPDLERRRIKDIFYIRS